MDRPKRPPPVPKFQDNNDKAQLQKKLNSFISSISQTTPPPAEATTPPPKQQQPKADPREQVGKKKLTLASLNSKLNNMLSAKKIAITTAISTEVQREKREQQKKAVEIEYDPNHPNSYQLAKHGYASLLASLQEQQLEQEQEVRATETEQGSEMVPQEAEEKYQLEEGYQVQQKEQVALRMMQRFGYRVGEGLGKQGQGIRTPLIVRKTTDSSGIIEQSAIPLNYLIPPQITAKNALSAHSVAPDSQVLVLVGLLNMQQLQEGVQEQIKQECCLHGVVCDWLLYLFQGELRIFVEFQNQEQAFNAFVKMNGKYFGERLVSVRFYAAEKFRNRVLSEPLHAHVPT